MLQEYLESSESGSEEAEASWYLMYLTCLIRVMYVGAMKFEEAAAIELANIATLDARRQHRDARSPTSRRSTLETSNIMITLRKEKTNQLAKNQEVILPKPDTSDGQAMDGTVHLNRYVTGRDVM